MKKIEVLNESKEKIGSDSYDNASYKWHKENVHSFDFIPSENLLNDYVLGKFLLEDAQIVETENNDTKQFVVSRYKLLCRNKNPKKQFDDAENSRWEEFPKK